MNAQTRNQKPETRKSPLLVSGFWFLVCLFAAQNEAAVHVKLSPPKPSVGDLITIDFDSPVVLDPSKDYEVVVQQGARVVVRTFEPRPFAMGGVMGTVRFRNLEIPVRSVLAANDNMKPSPLAPPRPQPYPREPFIAIAVAAALAIAVWAAVLLRTRQPMVQVVPSIDPAEQFERAVTELRARRDHARWARLADATREFLAATRPHLGADLTTTEVVPRLDEDEAVVRAILRQGDLEKFSLQGAEEASFDEIAERALALIRPEERAA